MSYQRFVASQDFVEKIIKMMHSLQLFRRKTESSLHQSKTENRANKWNTEVIYYQIPFLGGALVFGIPGILAFVFFFYRYKGQINYRHAFIAGVLMSFIFVGYFIVFLPGTIAGALSFLFFYKLFSKQLNKSVLTLGMEFGEGKYRLSWRHIVFASATLLFWLFLLRVFLAYKFSVG